ARGPFGNEGFFLGCVTDAHDRVVKPTTLDGSLADAALHSGYEDRHVGSRESAEGGLEMRLYRSSLPAPGFSLWRPNVFALRAGLNPRAADPKVLPACDTNLTCSLRFSFFLPARSCSTRTITRRSGTRPRPKKRPAAARARSTSRCGRPTPTTIRSPTASRACPRGPKRKRPRAPCRSRGRRPRAISASTR